MDNVEGLRTHIPDNSIDLTVTSPPYDELRNYNAYKWDFESLVKELHRVTKKGGVVVWAVNDQVKNGSESGNSFRQALYFKKIGFKLHDTMIYAKKNYVPLTHNRYEQQFEYMFVFSKGKPKTFNPIKVETDTGGTVRSYNYECATTDENASIRSGTNRQTIIKDKKIKPNIWFYKVGKNQSSCDDEAFEHPAIFPEKLAKDHIISWSNVGEVVLDPFIGSGTTAKMAELLNRKWIGFEVSQEYVNIAYKRVGKLDKKYYEKLPEEEQPAQKQLF